MRDSPARRRQHSRQGLLCRTVGKLKVLYEVVQHLAKRGFGVHRAGPNERFFRTDDHVLAPSFAVQPQQPVALGGNLPTLELKRVLAVQLLGVHELARHRQRSDARVPTVEPEKGRHRSGHGYTHLSVNRVSQ